MKTQHYLLKGLCFVCLFLMASVGYAQTFSTSGYGTNEDRFTINRDSTNHFSYLRLQVGKNKSWNMINENDLWWGYAANNDYDDRGGRLMTLTTGGRLGIGIASPGYALDVSGDVNATGFRVGGTPIKFGQWDKSGTNVHYNGGNVGIGTNSPTSPLHLSVSGGSTPADQGLLVNNTTVGSDEDAILAARVNSGSGDPFVSFDVNGVAGWSVGIDHSDDLKFKIGLDWSDVGSNPRLTIDTLGRVGIGGDPVAGDQLFVNGRIRFGDTEYFQAGGTNEIGAGGSIRPTSNNAFDLGSATYSWKDIHIQGSIHTSDRRSKSNIDELNYGLEDVMKMRPVTYNWIDQPEKGLQVGLIAQELNEIIPNVVYDPAEDFVRNESGELVPLEVTEDSRMGIDYALLTPVLIRAIQEQQAQLEAQQEMLEALQSGAKHRKFATSDLTGIELAKLYQNVPNPFSDRTEIKFFLPHSVKSATLHIYDMQGTPVSQIEIKERGESSWSVDGGFLSAGMYIYALIADGQEVDAKRMILTK